MGRKLIAVILLGSIYYCITHEDVTFFDNFLVNGNVWIVILMTYAFSVSTDIIAINKDSDLVAKAPPLFSSWLASLFILLTIPCIIWPPIYIGYYYGGWLTGVLAYIVLQITSFCLSSLINFKSTKTTFYFWSALISAIIAYYFSYMAITNQSITEQWLPYQSLAIEQLQHLQTLIQEAMQHLKKLAISLNEPLAKGFIIIAKLMVF